MSDERKPDLSLFVDILKTLESINAPYMIIGAFAGTVYGINRVTFDIDIVVDWSEVHIQGLSNADAMPRYYADPEMIRNSIEMGIMFNIIDTERGEKADLVPLSGTLDYRPAFERRVRQLVEVSGSEPFEVWCARAEDVVIGKLLAWQEGRSRKHETDIFDIMVFHYSKQDSDLDEAQIDEYAQRLAEDTNRLWQDIKAEAKSEAAKDK